MGLQLADGCLPSRRAPRPWTCAGGDEDGSTALAAWFDGLNDTPEWQHLLASRDRCDVLSFSHFLPLQVGRGGSGVEAARVAFFHPACLPDPSLARCHNTALPALLPLPLQELLPEKVRRVTHRAPRRAAAPRARARSALPCRACAAGPPRLSSPASFLVLSSPLAALPVLSQPGQGGGFNSAGGPPGTAAPRHPPVWPRALHSWLKSCCCSAVAAVLAGGVVSAAAGPHA